MLSNPNSTTKKYYDRPLSTYDNITAVFVPKEHELEHSNIDYKNKIGLDLLKNDLECYEIGNHAQRTKLELNNKLTSNEKNSLYTKEKEPFSVNMSEFPVLLENTGNNKDNNKYKLSVADQSPNLKNTKPAISDAKSKFFGLSEKQMLSEKIDCKRDELMSENKNLISKPHYQNIPVNSAIFQSHMTKSMMENNSVGSEHLNSKNDQDDKEQTDKDSYVLNLSTRSNRSNRNTGCFIQDSDSKYQPSQTVYMATTVPQNIKTNNIAGRHTPTRNSLRHSRMLVGSRNYEGSQSTNPLGLQYPKLARASLIFALLLGIVVLLISLWNLLWAPSTRVQDNPYWSGLSLILTGVLGLSVTQCICVSRKTPRKNCFFILRISSFISAILTGFLCSAAFVFAAIHLNILSFAETKCESANFLVANAACICYFGNGLPNLNSTGLVEQNFNEEYWTFHYMDLSCDEVKGAWRYILCVSAILNACGFITVVFYVSILYFRDQLLHKTYRSVKSDEI